MNSDTIIDKIKSVFGYGTKEAIQILESYISNGKIDELLLMIGESKG